MTTTTTSNNASMPCGEPPGGYYVTDNTYRPAFGGAGGLGGVLIGEGGSGGYVQTPVNTTWPFAAYGGGSCPGPLDDISQKILEDYFGKMTKAAWKEKVDGNRLTLRLDVPGVMPQTLAVQYTQGHIQVVGQRFDTQEKFNVVYALNQKYDPDSIEAKLEYGVLTIEVGVNDQWDNVKHVKIKTGA